MDRFSKCNPKATLLFFAVIILLTMLLYNPVYSAISLACAFCYKLKLDGKIAFSYFLKFVFPLLIVVSLFNMIFVHKGETVLFSAFDMSFTFEALFCGFSQGLMLSGVIVWFSCYSKVVTAEGFMSVFGKLAPDIALVFSMVLTFIPRLKRNLAEISDARALLDEEKSAMRKGISNLSALVTMTLEESIETADSMKARGFSNERKPYNRYPFSLRDGVVIAICCILLVLFIAVYRFTDKMLFIFEPKILMPDFSLFCVAVFALFSLMPLIIDVVEDVKWFYLKQKI